MIVMPEFILPAHTLEVTDEFTAAYIEAMFFTNAWDGVDEGDATDDDLNGFSRILPDGSVKSDYGPDDLAPQTIAVILAECAAFSSLGSELITTREAEAGRDFWFTREGHGVGFWDGDWDEAAPAWTDAETFGDHLTQLSKQFDEAEPYVGDDDLIYVSGYETWDAVQNRLSHLATIVGTQVGLDVLRSQ